MQQLEMKIVRGGITPVVLLLYLIIREFFFFSSKFSSSVPQYNQHQISFASQIFVSTKPSNLVVFLTVNIIVVALLLVGISTQFSSTFSSSSSSPELPILSFFEPFEGLKRVKDEEYVEYYDDDFVPRMVYVEYKEEKAPRMVYVEYKEEKAEGDQSYDDYCCYEEEEIINTDDQDHGYDEIDNQGQKDEVLMAYNYSEYDDDMTREEDSYGELDDDDFNKRIEEFIDENNKKWREELQNERLIDLNGIIT